MAKSADQKHATPPSSLPAYVFRGPAYVAIRTRTNDQPRYVDTRQKVWTWYDGGIALKKGGLGGLGVIRPLPARCSMIVNEAGLE